MTFGTCLCYLFYKEQSPSYLLQWNGRSRFSIEFGDSTLLLLSFCDSILASCWAHTARQCNSGARINMQSQQENIKELEAWASPKTETRPPICKCAGQIVDVDRTQTFGWWLKILNPGPILQNVLHFWTDLKTCSKGGVARLFVRRTEKTPSEIWWAHTC